MTTTTDLPTTNRRVDHPNGRETLWFLETSKETQGTRTFLEAHLAPGASNDTHFHTAYSETFEVLEGVLLVELDGDTLHLTAGQTAVVPIGTRHRFANDSLEDVRFRCALEPASRGFEEALQIMAGLQRDGKLGDTLPKDPRVLAVLLDLCDSRLCGALRLLTPPLRLASRLGRARDIEGQLRQRYVSW